MKNKEIFKDIIGYDETKKTLKRIIDILNNKEKYKRLGAEIPHGLLLYGPPGLGKTTFSKSFISSTTRKQYIIRKNNIDGDFIRYIKDIFNKAKETQPSIILLDDLDKFTKSNDSDKNQEEFVTIQSFIDDIKDKDIFVVATVNDINILPESLLRSGRFDIKIKIDKPSSEESYKIFNHYISKKQIDKNVDIKKISYILDNNSCADLEKICNQAAIYAGYNNKKKIGMKELIRSALELEYNCIIENTDKPNKYALKTAYHEAGHAIISSLLEPDSVLFISIINTNSDINGFNKIKKNKDYYKDVKFRINRIKVLLAGKAAKEIVYGQSDIGASSDIRQAFNIAETLIDDNCIDSFDSFLVYKESPITRNLRNMRITILIEQCYKEVKELLINNREKLDTLANKLFEEKILFKEDINSIINPID